MQNNYLFWKYIQPLQPHAFLRHNLSKKKHVSYITPCRTSCNNTDDDIYTATAAASTTTANITTYDDEDDVVIYGLMKRHCLDVGVSTVQRYDKQQVICMPCLSEYAYNDTLLFVYRHFTGWFLLLILALVLVMA